MQVLELNNLLNDLSRKSIESFVRERDLEKKNFIPAMEKSLKILQTVGQEYVSEKSYLGNGSLRVSQRILLGMFWYRVTESIGYDLKDVEKEELTWSVKPTLNYLTEFSVALVYPKNLEEIRMYGELTSTLGSFGVL
ncbi:MAG: hypothetical protein HY833_03355 [Candidatus Aenigmarchaeota archaeon]|nr:hypothetical protein [Candidatus Aenigmarchaeota archaeon]